MNKLHSLFILFLLHGTFAVAQTGIWMPSNADYSYPRTLLKQQEIPAVQAWLQHPEIYPLYVEIDRWVSSYTPPATLSTTYQRRWAAHQAKNAAFMYLLNRKPTVNGPDTLSAAEALKLRDLSIELLNKINTQVAGYPNFDEYLWRSNEICDNLIAYDLLKGAGVPDSLLATGRNLLEEYTANLHREITISVLGISFFSTRVNNHAVRSCGALGLAGIVLNETGGSDPDRRAFEWFQTAMWNLDNVLWRSAIRQSERGVIAGYAEGPHYLRFGFKHVLPFFHALHNFLPDTTFSLTFTNNTRSIRHPWHDPDYGLLYEWVLGLRMPDGRMPALEDAFIDVSYPELAILENPAYTFPVFLDKLDPIQTNTLEEQLKHSTDDVTADFIASRTLLVPDSLPELIYLPESGSAVFRSGQDSAALYLHLYGQNGLPRASARGHNQADVSSFILMGHQQLLAMDPGYLRWGRREEVNAARHHNLILVDSAGPLAGTITSSNGANGFLERPIELPRFKHVGVRTQYAGADIHRKLFFLRNAYFVAGDEALSSGQHHYAWRLHGFGLASGDSATGTFFLDPQESQARWHKNGVTLLAHVTAEGGIDRYRHTTEVHEYAYDSTQKHSALQAEVSGASRADFLAVLSAYKLDSPLVRNLCSPDCGALEVSWHGYQDFWMNNGLITRSASGLPDDLTSDARLAFLSIDSAGDWQNLYLVGGEELKMGNDFFISADTSMELALAVMDSQQYRGWTDASGWVRFFDLSFEPGSVLGPGVDRWTWQPTDSVLYVFFKGPGYFDIHKDVILSLDQAGIDREESRFSLYPQPAGTEVHLLSSNPGPVTWSLRSLDGKQLLSGKHSFNASGDKFLIDLGDFLSGVYLLEISGFGRTEVLKVLKF